MADTPTTRDRKTREQLDADVLEATRNTGEKLAAADAKRDRRKERAARAELDRSVLEAQRSEAKRSPIISRHTFTGDDGKELEGKEAARAQQAAVVAAMDAENDRRADELGLPAPAHYADGTP